MADSSFKHLRLNQVVVHELVLNCAEPLDTFSGRLVYAGVCGAVTAVGLEFLGSFLTSCDTRAVVVSQRRHRAVR